MNIDYIQLGLALCVGISLAAACGFRVFVPLLAMALGVRYMGMDIDENLAWIAGDAAIICLGAATVVEVLAYYIPVVDNLLDTITGPAAMVAGAFVAAGMLGDLPDWVQWGTGIVAGAGAAGTVQLTTTAARAGSTSTTAAVGNPIISTIENVLSVIGSFLAIFAPLLAVVGAILLIFLTFFFLRKILGIIRKRKAATTAAATA